MMRKVDRPDLSAEPDTRILENAFHSRRRGEHQDALDRFLFVFQRDPSNAFVLIEAARCEGLRLHFAGMRELLGEAEARAAEDPLVFQMIGDAWLAHLFPEEALAAYQRGRDRDPENVELLARFLEAMERANRLDEAQVILEGLTPALRRAPALLPVRVVLARRQGRWDKAVEWARLFLREPRLAPMVEARMALELARSLDALRRPEEAWASLLRAQRLFAANPEAEFERRLWPRHVEFLHGVEQRLTAAHLAAWRLEAGRLPARRLAFLVGHPRSGTTVMERILDAHPEIATASEYPVFERCMVEAFASWKGAAAPSFLAGDPPGFDLAGSRAFYGDLMETVLTAPLGTRLLLDKNPALTEGLHGVLRVFPEAKFIVMLRDPRDVILSCLFQDFGVTRLGVACHCLAGAVAAWVTTMGHWIALRALLPGEQWREIRYEEFVGRATEATAEITHFLGCGESGPTPEASLTRGGFIRTPSYHQIGRAVRSDAVGKWPAYAAHFEPFREQLLPVMTALGYPW